MSMRNETERILRARILLELHDIRFRLRPVDGNGSSSGPLKSPEMTRMCSFRR